MLFIPLWAYFWSHCYFATVVHGFPLGKTSRGHFRTLFVQMRDSFVVKVWGIYFAAVNSNKYANLLFNPIFFPPYLSFCEFLVRKQLEKLMIDFSCVGAGWGKAKRITWWTGSYGLKFGIKGVLGVGKIAKIKMVMALEFPCLRRFTLHAIIHEWWWEPLKVKMLACLVACGRVNTCDHIQKRSPNVWISPHWCILCKVGEDSVDNLFLYCPFLYLWGVGCSAKLICFGLFQTSTLSCKYIELLSIHLKALGKGEKLKEKEKKGGESLKQISLGETFLKA